MAGKRELNKQKKYYDFISAASRLFEEKGVEHTKVSEIAEKVATGSKTLHRYFATKNTLILAILIEDDIMSLKRLELRLKKLPDHPVDKVVEMLSVYVDYGSIIKNVSVWREYESVRILEYNNQLNKEDSTKLRLSIIDLIKSVLMQCCKEGKLNASTNIDNVTTSLHAIALLNYHRTLREEFCTEKDALDALYCGVSFALKPYISESN
ncbi:TetR family transcriptional regulator [Ochrobactrum sp. BH3]|nr:TetR family transcriptional regulator [Ochrobactrum sp. BH3]